MERHDEEYIKEKHKKEKGIKEEAGQKGEKDENKHRRKECGEKKR
jgi:hypothetical protein